MRRLPLDPNRLDVAADITGAATLPGAFYGDPALHELAVSFLTHHFHRLLVAALADGTA